MKGQARSLPFAVFGGLITVKGATFTLSGNILPSLIEPIGVSLGIEPPEVSLGPGGCLGILPEPVLCMRILHGLDLSGTFHRADVSGTLRGADVEDLFLGPDVSRLLLRADVPALLHRPSLYSGIWCRLYRSDLCPCIF